MINSGRLGVSAENFPLGGALPDVQFDLTSGLNGDALVVNEHLRAMAGVTLALAAQQIRPDTLKNLALDRSLSVKVLVVPKELTGEGMPMQFGPAEAELDFHLHGNDLTLSGWQCDDTGRHEPTSGAQFGWVGGVRGPGVWRPSRAYAGTRSANFSDYRTVPIKPFERDEARRGVGYERLVMAAHSLGEVASHAIGKLAERGKFGIQVEVNGKTSVTPVVTDPYTAALRHGQAAYRAALLSGAI